MAGSPTAAKIQVSQTQEYGGDNFTSSSVWSVFAKDVVGCFCHGSVKAVDQSVYFGVLIFKGEEWSKLCSCSKKFCDVGILEFLQTEPDPYAAMVFHPLEMESEGHHYKLMVTSDVGSWKAPGLCIVNT